MLLQNVILPPDTRANQPAASAANNGFLYSVTDENNKMERSNGTTWETYAGGGGGTITKTGSPASGNLAKFTGASSISNADLTGDVTTSGTVATTLATVVSASTKTKITYNAKGLVTAGADAVLADLAATTADFSMNTHKLTNVTDPASAQDAATKAYVDATKVASIEVVIDGGGATITTGIKVDVEVPFACTINRVTMLADQSGSIVVDIWKDTYANYPPVVGDSITASAKPTITTALKSQDSTLTGWTTSVAAGDTLRFNVDSVTTIQRVLVSLKVTKT